MAAHWYRYLSLLGYNLGICTFHGAGLMEVVCPLLHLPEGARTEDAPTRTGLGGFCVKPAGQAGYMGQQKLEAEPLQKVKWRIRKLPWVPWEKKKKLPVILSGRSLIQVSFNNKPRTCWVESEQHCWKWGYWSRETVVKQRRANTLSLAQMWGAGKEKRFFGPSGLVLGGHHLS